MQFTNNVSLFRLFTKTVIDIVAERDEYEALAIVNYEILPHVNKLDAPFLDKVQHYSERYRTMSWDSKMAPPLFVRRTACTDASDGRADSAAGFGRRSRRWHNRCLRPTAAGVDDVARILMLVLDLEGGIFRNAIADFRCDRSRSVGRTPDDRGGIARSNPHVRATGSDQSLYFRRMGFPFRSD